MHLRKITLIIVSLFIASCSQPTQFELEVKKTDWFETIDAPEVNTPEEVSKLWQSEKRCCEDENKLQTNNRIFYKACYNAIAEHFNDDELVTKCLWLMDIAVEREQAIQLTRFLVENYANHKSSTKGCVNCEPGDVIARETLTLAQYESADNLEDAINLIESLFERRSDISLWVQAEIYQYLATLYLKTEVSNERMARLTQVDQTLKAAADNNKLKDWRYTNFQRSYKQVVEQYRH